MDVFPGLVSTPYENDLVGVGLVPTPMKYRKVVGVFDRVFLQCVYRKWRILPLHFLRLAMSINKWQLALFQSKLLLTYFEGFNTAFQTLSLPR